MLARVLYDDTQPNPRPRVEIGSAEVVPRWHYSIYCFKIGLNVMINKEGDIHVSRFTQALINWDPST